MCSMSKLVLFSISFHYLYNRKYEAKYLTSSNISSLVLFRNRVTAVHGVHEIRVHEYPYIVSKFKFTLAF